MELRFALHDAQLEIFNDPHRFKVVAAGRRFGKSYLSAVTLLIEALKEENEKGYDIKSKSVYYVAPTFQQGKDTMWRLLKDLGQSVIESTVENVGVIRLVNGREICLKGSDRPDTLRGVGLSYVVLDEFATMKPEVWEQIIRPTLADVEGGALFIGTPDGKNHFYTVFENAKDDPEWGAFSYYSVDNPFLKKEEIESARKSMSHEAFRQEFEASFQSFGGGVFREEDILIADEPEDADCFMAVDLAGFGEESELTRSALKRRDESAIAVVKVTPNCWHVCDIIHGQWGTRETSLRILRAAQIYKPRTIGIEKGALKNAVMPYLQDQMLRLAIFPHIKEVTHGGKRKEDRIAWALQGRMQNHRITFSDKPYLKRLKDQMMDFPNPMAHDDLLDALAYIDQVAYVSYNDDAQLDSFEPLDIISGY